MSHQIDQSLASLAPADVADNSPVSSVQPLSIVQAKRKGSWLRGSFLDAVGHGILFDVEADLGQGRFGRRRGRVEDLHDALENIDNNGLVDVKARLEFRFHGGQFPSEFPGIGERGAHFDERADNEDAHLGGLCAVENVCGHDGTVFGERVGGEPGVAVFLGTGHNL